MSFQSPLALLGLAVLPLAVWAYVAAQRRRPRYAARFTNLDLLATVVSQTPSWRRHVPPVLVALALVALLVALARPQATFAVAKEQASVMLVTDVSGSMESTDVDPTRLDAARRAAKSFAGRLPDELRLGLVTFSSAAQVAVPPTTDRSVVDGALDAMAAQGGTAMGDGLYAGVSSLRQAVARASRDPGSDAGGGSRGGQAAPAVIVLLSDGASASGSREPLDVADEAKRLGIPINTVALGTDDGTVTISQGGFERTIPVPPDRATLREIARITGGRAFDAPDSNELDAVYEDLGSRIGTKREKREITAGFAGGGVLLLLGAGALSLLWFGRVP